MFFSVYAATQTFNSSSKKDQLVPPGTGKLVNKSPATTLRQPYQTGSTGLPGTLGMIHENLYFLVL